MFSIPEYPVTDIADILLMPGLAIFFGLLVFLLGEFNESLKGGAVWKWVGAVILFLGSLSGFRYFLAMVSGSFEGKAYQAQIFQRRLVYTHYAAFWLPLICLAVVAAVSVWRKKQRRLLYDEF